MINLIRRIFPLYALFATLITTGVSAEESSVASTGLLIKCDPSGVDVYIDNVKVGKASPEFQKLGFAPDQVVTVSLRKKDYNTLTFKVQVQKGLNRFEKLRLKPAFGYLTLTGVPPDAEVTVDTRKIGRLDKIDRFRLKSGRYRLSIQKQGFEPINKYVKIFDDEILNENIELKKIPDANKSSPQTKKAKKTTSPDTEISPEILPTEHNRPEEPEQTAKKDTRTKETSKSTFIPKIFSSFWVNVKQKVTSAKKALKTEKPVPLQKAPLNSIKTSSETSGKTIETSAKVPEKNIVVIKNPGQNRNSSLVEPEVMSIMEGEQVLWKNQDDRFHYIVYKPEFSLYSSYGKEDEEEEEEDTAQNLFSSPKLNNGDTWSYRFNKPGSYSYYCFIHPLEVVGKIVVLDSDKIPKRVELPAKRPELSILKKQRDPESALPEKPGNQDDKHLSAQKEPTGPVNAPVKDPVTNLVTINNPENSEGAFINNPASMNIKAGERVSWNNRDKRFHYIVYKPRFSLYTSYGKEDEDEEEEEDTTESLFGSPKLNTGDTWSFQFTKPGSYSYYCFIHPLEVVGTIVVE